MTYHMRLLGRFHLSAPDGSEIAMSAKKNQALMAVLAVSGGDWIPRSRLCDLLWEDRADEQARNSLRQAISALRRTFGPHETFPLLVNDDAIALDAEMVSVDIGGLNGAGGRDAIDTPAYGEFLEGLSIPDQSIQDWLLAQRQRFGSLCSEALAARVREHEDTGRKDEALVAARALLEADRLNESAHRAVIRLLAATGQRSAALKHYQACCDVLKTELGIEPEPATRQLYDTLRAGGNGEPARDARASESTEGELPSIVVLPFVNLSGDPAQNYVCDGLTDSITTELSRFHDLRVMASASAYAYRDRRDSIVAICNQLGVGFALEGGVQRIGDRIRINVQLIDGTSGQQLWSERYDRLFDDFFAIQDEVTEIIVATLGTSYGGRLRKAWQRQRGSVLPTDIKAFDLFMRGIDSVDTFTPEGVSQGREFIQQAIALDPGFSKAHAKLAWTHIIEAIEGWSTDFESCMAVARLAALEAIRLDDGESWGYWTLAACNIFTGNHDLGLEQTETVLRLNPNDADVLADYGYFLSFAGRAEEGIAPCRKAMQLNPHHPEWYLLDFIQICFDARRYKDVIAAFARLRHVRTTTACLLLAASHAALGEGDKASAAVGRALHLDSGASMGKWVDGPLLPYRLDSDREHLRTLLRKAGAPE